MLRTILAQTCAVFLFTAGCDEPFPSAQEPENVLRVEATAHVPDTVTAILDPLFGKWSFINQLSISVQITNTYDNLLQGEAHPEGRVDIQAFTPSAAVIVQEMGRGQLRKPPIFGGAISLPPDSSAEFQVLWIPMGPDERPVWEGGSFVPGSEPGVRFYGPIEFAVKGEVRLFERIQPVQIPEHRFTLFIKTM